MSVLKPPLVPICVTSMDSIELRSSGPRDSESGHDAASEAQKEPSTQGILVVTAGFICNFMVFGIGFSYGVFQEFYTSSSGPLRHYSASEVSIVGTLGLALTYLCGIFNKTLLFYFSPRQVMLFGSVLMSAGLIAAGSSSKIYQFVITQGLMFGVGLSLVYLPPVVIVPTLFSRNRAIATGIVFAGTGCGGFVFAFLTRWLISQVGWRWCLRILGFVNLAATSLASLLVAKPTTRYNTDNKVLNLSQIKSWRVWLQLAGSLLQAAGYLTPLIFMSKYGRALGYSENQGALFIAVNNAINAVFKVVLGFGADRIGRLNMILICSVVSSITVFALWMVGTRGTFIAFVVLYGIFSGAIISLLPTCLMDLFGVANYQALTGLMYFSRGIGNMLGSPIAALLITGNGSNAGDFRNAIIYNGVMLAASTLCLAALRVIFRLDLSWKL